MSGKESSGYALAMASQEALAKEERAAAEERVLRSLRNTPDLLDAERARMHGASVAVVAKLRKQLEAERAAEKEFVAGVAASPAVTATRVQCIVTGGELGARECVEQQRTAKCFCPRASFAINALTPLALPGSRLADQLDACRAVARSVLLLPAQERYLGPALVALRGGKPVPVALIQGELPAAPKTERASRPQEAAHGTEAECGKDRPLPEPRKPERAAQERAAGGDRDGGEQPVGRRGPVRAEPDGHVLRQGDAVQRDAQAGALELAAPRLKRLCAGGCGSQHSSSKYDKCWRCRAGLKKHRADTPDDESIFGGGSPRAEALPPPLTEKLPPLLSTKEKPMPRFEMKNCAHEGCNELVVVHSKSGLCTPHAAAARHAAKKAGGRPSAPKSTPKPHPAKPAVIPHAAPEGDILLLLEQQRAHHAQQLARIDRALAALRE